MYKILAEINAYDFHLENIYERVAKLLAYIDGGNSWHERFISFFLVSAALI